jgi:hypothetical protein
MIYCTKWTKTGIKSQPNIQKSLSALEKNNFILCLTFIFSFEGCCAKSTNQRNDRLIFEKKLI